MSGGHWNYQDSNLKNEIFDWADDFKSNPLKDIELSELVWDVLDLLHDYDWYVSGDTGSEDWLKAKKAFKAKWLKQGNTERLERIIDERIADVRKELGELL